MQRPAWLYGCQSVQGLCADDSLREVSLRQGPSGTDGTRRARRLLLRGLRGTEAESSYRRENQREVGGDMRGKYRLHRRSHPAQLQRRHQTRIGKDQGGDALQTHRRVSARRTGLLAQPRRRR